VTLVILHATQASFQVVTDERLFRRGVPSGRCSKILPIPHLGAAVIGAGFTHLTRALVLAGWGTQGDASALAAKAQKVLCDAWTRVTEARSEAELDEMEHRYDEGDEGTSIFSGFGGVSLIGYARQPSGQPQPCWWLFGPRDFAPKHAYIPPYVEGAPFQLAARYVNGRPKDWAPGEIAEKYQTLDEMIDLALRIKAERDEAGDPSQTVGGALWASTLTLGTGGPVFTTQRVVDFGDE
jgi:hypothetical protein